MAKIIPNANSWIGFSTTAPANQAAPTETELDASTVLTPLVVSITASASGNAIPTPALDSLFDRSIIGTSQASFSADLYRDSTADTAWTALPRGTAGYFYISRFGGSGTNAVPRAGNGLEVWPVSITSRAGSQLTSNTVQTFTIQAAVPNVPSEAAICASGTGVPSAPLNPLATAGATGIAIIDFTLPLSIGASAITAFKLYRAPTVGGTYTLVASGTTNYLTSGAVYVTGLTAGAAFFKVVATNASGDSAQSIASNGITVL